MGRYKGIIPPLVTPLAGRDKLDREGFERLIERVITGGVHGLFVLGTTGEAQSLSYGLRREVIRLACKLTRGRVPVFVGITDTSSVETVKLAEVAHTEGADALVLTAPYYFPAGQTELFAYIKDLLPRLGLPLMLYNFPAMTKIWFEIETLKYLADLDGIAGIKDSSGDITYYKQICKLKKIRPDWSIFIGPEALMPLSLDIGGDGGISGGANVYPELFVGCYNAKMAGDTPRVEELSNKIEAFQELYTVGKYASKYIKATKCCLSVLGICDDYMEQPFHRFRPEHRAMITEMLQRFGIEG
jgi:dihydrodipicolinate synthase/N-acetylneuraminate lyase